MYHISSVPATNIEKNLNMDMYTCMLIILALQGVLPAAMYGLLLPK